MKVSRQKCKEVILIMTRAVVLNSMKRHLRAIKTSELAAENLVSLSNRARICLGDGGI